MTIRCNVASTKTISEASKEGKRENPRSDAMTGFDVPEGAFFLSPGFQVSCGLAARLDNRLRLNVRFERERVDWIYGYRHAIFRTNVRRAHSVGSLARTSARSFLLISSFEDRGQLPGTPVGKECHTIYRPDAD